MTQAATAEIGTPPLNRFINRAAAAMLCGLAFANGEPAIASPAQSAGLGDCAPYADTSTFRNHELEVCTAYKFNSAGKALRLFYKFGNNSVGYLADPAEHHFETRYFEGPRRSIEREVDSWPTTRRFKGNKVSAGVDIVSLSSKLKADRALLRTWESWKVTAPNGRVLHRERSHQKNITMCRGQLPGHPLHLWVVAKFSRDPNYDCKAFDKRHGLKP